MDRWGSLESCYTALVLLAHLPNAAFGRVSDQNILQLCLFGAFLGLYFLLLLVLLEVKHHIHGCEFVFCCVKRREREEIACSGAKKKRVFCFDGWVDL